MWGRLYIPALSRQLLFNYLQAASLSGCSVRAQAAGESRASGSTSSAKAKKTAKIKHAGQTTAKAPIRDFTELGVTRLLSYRKDGGIFRVADIKSKSDEFEFNNLFLLNLLLLRFVSAQH